MTSVHYTAFTSLRMLGNRCSLYQEMWAAGGRKKKDRQAVLELLPWFGGQGIWHEKATNGLAV